MTLYEKHFLPWWYQLSEEIRWDLERDVNFAHDQRVCQEEDGTQEQFFYFFAKCKSKQPRDFFTAADIEGAKKGLDEQSAEFKILSRAKPGYYRESSGLRSLLLDLTGRGL
jgi:hypothetical protein